MLNNYVKKLLDLAHEKLVNILGGHDVGTNNHACQRSLQMSIYLCTKIGLRLTIIYGHFVYLILKVLT